MIEVISLETKTFSNSTLYQWGELCLIWGKHSSPAGSLVLVSDTKDLDSPVLVDKSADQLTIKRSFIWIDQSLLPSLMIWALSGLDEAFPNGFALREHVWPSAKLEPYELLYAFDCPKSFSGKAYQFDKELVCMDPTCTVQASHCHMAQISAQLPSVTCPNTRHY